MGEGGQVPRGQEEVSARHQRLRGAMRAAGLRSSSAIPCKELRRDLTRSAL